MADRFIERVGQTAGQTVRRLKELQLQLYEIGLTAQAQDLDKLIREHEDIAFDCYEDTQVPGLPPHPRTPPGASKPTDK